MRSESHAEMSSAPFSAGYYERAGQMSIWRELYSVRGAAGFYIHSITISHVMWAEERGYRTLINDLPR